METNPRFLQGVFSFSGHGLSAAGPLEPPLGYTVPADKRTQLIYFRAGNSADEVVAVTLTKNGAPFRVFPIGAKANTHVSLAVVEDLMPDTDIAVTLAAPAGINGELVLDIGMIEI